MYLSNNRNTKHVSCPKKPQFKFRFVRMKAEIFFLLAFQTVSSFNVNLDSEKVDNISDAINNLLTVFLVKTHSTINMVKMHDSEIDEVTLKILTNLNENSQKSIRIEDYLSLSLNQTSDRKKFLNFIVLDSVESFMKFEKSLNTSNFDSNGYFLIALLYASFQDCNQIFKAFWIKKFYNVDVLTTSNISKIELATFMPFSEGKCEKPTTEVINQFNMTARKWVNENFYPEKFKNLHGCKFKHEITQANTVKQSNGKIGGREIDMIDVIGKILNFTSDHKHLKLFGTLNPNGTASGILKHIYDGEITLGSGALQLERTKLLSAGTQIYSDPLILVIPPAASFSSIQKLYKPFDAKVWAGIFLVFVISMLLAMIILKRFKLLVKGMNVNHFIITKLNSFFGGSIPFNRLPNGNFMRIVLSSFMLYSLVIRTAYIGVLFNYLRVDMKQKEVANVDEMMENDFTFYAFESMYHRTVDFKFFNR